MKRRRDAAARYRERHRETLNAKAREYHRRRWPKIRHRVKATRLAALEAHYGVSYAEELRKQRGRCAACRRRKPGGRYGRFAFDHDHRTGRFRGLLCQTCNTAIGHAKDDPKVLLRMVKYLAKSKRVR